MANWDIMIIIIVNIEFLTGSKRMSIRKKKNGGCFCSLLENFFNSDGTIIQAVNSLIYSNQRPIIHLFTAIKDQSELAMSC